MLSADFLILGINALLIGLLANIFGISDDKKWWLLLIFIFISLLNLFILRKIIKPILRKVNESKGTGGKRSMLGQKFIVQIVDKKKVIYLDGEYKEISSKGKIKSGDTVEVLEEKKKFLVKKVF